MLSIEIPGWKLLQLHSLLLDFNGTLALDGKAIPGVQERLKALSSSLAIHIATAGTHGPVKASDFPFLLQIRQIALRNQAEQKRKILDELGTEHTAAVGNGENDILMLKEAALGIAVVGPEGASSRAIQAAQVVVRDILEGLDLLLHPKRLSATLRR